MAPVLSSLCMTVAAGSNTPPTPPQPQPATHTHKCSALPFRLHSIRSAHTAPPIPTAHRQPAAVSEAQLIISTRHRQGSPGDGPRSPWQPGRRAVACSVCACACVCASVTGPLHLNGFRQVREAGGGMCSCDPARTW